MSKNSENFNTSEGNVKEDNISLTELWKKGELPFGRYYIKDINNETFADNYTNNGFINGFEDFFDVEIKEVLAPVPSYEKWQGLNKDIDIITGLWKHERRQLNEKIQLMGHLSVRVVDLNNEIKQLKNLLKECRDFINYEVPDHCIDDVLIDKVDEVLK